MSVNPSFDELLAELSNGVKECNVSHHVSYLDRKRTHRELQSLVSELLSVRTDIKRLMGQNVEYSQFEQQSNEIYSLNRKEANIQNSINMKGCILEDSRPKSDKEKKEILKPILHKFNELFSQKFREFKHETFDKFVIEGQVFLEGIGKFSQERDLLLRDLINLQSELVKLKEEDVKYSEVQKKEADIKEYEQRISSLNPQRIKHIENAVKTMLELIEEFDVNESLRYVGPVSYKFRDAEIHKFEEPIFLKEFSQKFLSLYDNFSICDVVIETKYGITKGVYEKRIKDIIQKHIHVDVMYGYLGVSTYRTYMDEEMSGSGFGTYKVEKTVHSFDKY